LRGRGPKQHKREKNEFVKEGEECENGGFGVGEDM